MVNLFDAPPTELIEKAAVELKKSTQFAPPAWAVFAKTGVHKERPPVNEGWWHIRVAAILRSVYKLGPVGTQKLRVKFGGKKSRGHMPEEFRKGSGSVVRKALQQLEKAGYVKQVEKGVHKGRVVTPQGKSFLDKVALGILKAKPKPAKAVQKTQAQQPDKADQTAAEVITEQTDE